MIENVKGNSGVRGYHMHRTITCTLFSAGASVQFVMTVACGRKAVREKTQIFPVCFHLTCSHVMSSEQEVLCVHRVWSHQRRKHILTAHPQFAVNRYTSALFHDFQDTQNPVTIQCNLHFSLYGNRKCRQPADRYLQLPGVNNM